MTFLPGEENRGSGAVVSSMKAMLLYLSYVVESVDFAFLHFVKEKRLEGF